MNGSYGRRNNRRNNRLKGDHHSLSHLVFCRLNIMKKKLIERLRIFIHVGGYGGKIFLWGVSL